MWRLIASRDTLAVTLVCLVLLLAHNYRAGQDYNWDFLNYHFYAGYMLLANRLGVDVIPAMMQTYLNPIPYVLPYLTIRHLPPLGAAAALTAVHVLNLTAVYVLAKLVFRRLYGDVRLPLALMCVAVGVTGPSFLPEVGSSMADITTSVLVTFGLAGAIAGLQSGTLRPLIVAGLLVGAAAGLKQTNGLFLLGMGVALVAVPAPWVERLRRAAAFGVAAGLATLALALPWMIPVYQAFKNPLFPFYNTIFRSPLGSLTNPGDYRYFPTSLWQGLGYPVEWVFGRNPAGEIALRDARFLVLFVLLATIGIGWLIRRARPRPAGVEAMPWTRRDGVALGVAAFLVVGFTAVSQVLWIGQAVWVAVALAVLAVPLAFWLASRPAAPGPVGGAEDRDVIVFLSVYWVATFAIWLKAFAVERYLLPMELVSGIVMLVLLGAVIRRPRLRVAAFGALCLLVVAWAQPAYWPRLPWSDQWIRATMPAPMAQPDVLYVMTGHEPYAYLAPLFPESARFLRIDGNYPLEPEAGLGRVALERIRAHRGELRAMIPVVNEPGALVKLASFGLRPAETVGVIDQVQSPIKVVRLTR
ncbi:MAG: hypothetical protein ACK46X_00580 [Candidatus Sericytochromatia bacterium]